LKSKTVNPRLQPRDWGKYKNSGFSPYAVDLQEKNIFLLNLQSVRAKARFILYILPPP
jgi:hypothetical protein